MTDTVHKFGDGLLEDGHLDELAVEALATDREDLVSEAALDHLDACEPCAERVYLERVGVEDASVALERIIVEFDDLDSMIAQAMSHYPEEGAAVMGAAPSRRSLSAGAALGVVSAIGLALLSLPGAEALSGLSTAGSQVWTLGRALDSVVESAIPGGWALLAVVGLLFSLALVVPMRFFLGTKPLRPGPAVTSMLAIGMLAVLSAPSSLAHAYQVEGQWPEPQPRVSVDVDRQPTSEALRQAVQSSGLGVVVRLPVDPLVTLHVADAPLGEVVEALLGTSDVVVRPGANLVTVRPAEPSSADSASADPSTNPAGADSDPASETGASETGASQTDGPEPVRTPPAPPTPPTPSLAVPSVPALPATPTMPALPAAPHAPGSSHVANRITFGGDVVVGPDEEVRDVVTMGGDAVMQGRAFGSVVTMGGDADIEGEVIGDVITMGGNIRVGAGSRVHGEINAMGGEVEISDDANVHGEVESSAESSASSRSPHAHLSKGDLGLSGVFRWALFNVMLFLFGLFLLGAYRKRFSTLRAELADRPVRSALGGLFGAMAGTLICGVLTLTLIGIPGSLVLGTLLVVGGAVGWTAAAYRLGSALPFKRLEGRPVPQLAVGLMALFAVGLVPGIGTLAVVAAVAAGLGAVIATSFGQKATAQKKGKHVPTGPFRTGAGR